MSAVAKTDVRQWYFVGAQLSDTFLIDRMINSVCDEFNIPSHRRVDLELVLCEVMTNSIDHGILGMDSRIKKTLHGFEQYFISRAAKLSELTEGSILVSVEQHTPRQIRVTVEDSGNGFCYPQVHTDFPSGCLTLAYGRGLLIVGNLCDSMTHIGNGNCVVLDFDL